MFTYHIENSKNALIQQRFGLKAENFKKLDSLVENSDCFYFRYIKPSV